MAFIQRTDTACGNGSALLDLSTTDATWDITTVPISQQLFVEGAGDVKFTGADGVVDTWAVPANTAIPVRMVKVWKVGTTATKIHSIS